ncbi:MAG: hypothetical protein LC776_09635 [Acidobacteria bacterium]|nr:hypothetical protein [Acidobacteriota bacterium]
MTSDASKSPERVLGLPGERRAAPPSDDSVAEGLRGFGPLGVLAILVILFAGNYPFVPLSAILVLVWDLAVAHAMARYRLRLAQELDTHPGRRHLYWNLESKVAHLIFE